MESNEQKFSREALKNSRLFKDRKDLISALLEDDKEYSREEAEELIKNYLKGEVG